MRDSLAARATIPVCASGEPFAILSTDSTCRKMHTASLCWQSGAATQVPFELQDRPASHRLKVLVTASAAFPRESITKSPGMQALPIFPASDGTATPGFPLSPPAPLSGMPGIPASSPLGELPAFSFAPGTPAAAFPSSTVSLPSHPAASSTAQQPNFCKPMVPGFLPALLAALSLSDRDSHGVGSGCLYRVRPSLQYRASAVPTQSGSETIGVVRSSRRIGASVPTKPAVSTWALYANPQLVQLPD